MCKNVQIIRNQKKIRKKLVCKQISALKSKVTNHVTFMVIQKSLKVYNDLDSFRFIDWDQDEEEVNFDLDISYSDETI